MEHYVITIARGFGSGGKEIGSKLGKSLGIPCYESQILKMASDQSGLNEALFNRADEKLSLYGEIKNYLGRVPFEEEAKPFDKAFVSNDNLFQIQSKIIRHLALSESCIIIGKCADYVLRDFSNVISVYVEAPRKACVESITNKLGITEAEAHKLIEKTDRYRADYYHYYTRGGTWTNPINYDLTLNSDRIGRDKCVELLKQYIDLKFDNK